MPLSGKQIRMARAALEWSVQELSNVSSVSTSTIKRIEASGAEIQATPANLKLIRETLEAAGVEFIGAAGDGPGIRLWRE